MAETHICLDDELIKLSETIFRELDPLWGRPNEIEKVTIFPVPYKFREAKKNLFDPSVISIGPFHHGKEGVQAMEEQKLRFLRDFLSRGDHINLDLCLYEIKNLEDKARQCYSEKVPSESNGFVKMMLLDGCFVLEYFLKWYEHRLNSIGHSDHSVFILSDLLLLENQIPFFIVDKLCEIGLKPEDRKKFTNYLVNIFAQAGPAGDSTFSNPPVTIHFSEGSPVKIFLSEDSSVEIHHFIHLCYHSTIASNQITPVRSESFHQIRIISLPQVIFLWVLTRIFRKSNSLPNSIRKSLMAIPCATELQSAGIELRRNRNPHHMLDITFDRDVLAIPRLTITNESKTLLANLIAFEQYKSDQMSTNLSSFALFLHSLVNTPEDVMILQQCGIINNRLDSEEELSDFFNQICKGMVVKNDHFLAKLFKDVNKYCESRLSRQRVSWKRHKTQFIRTYFSSPWTAISLVAGVFVVLLTFVQAFFAVYAYYVPPS